MVEASLQKEDQNVTVLKINKNVLLGYSFMVDFYGEKMTAM